ncbi:RdRP-domain-containing protein [Desarmillaria ectypa]|nr:RdRP-domain-containing protein [Desarmillaria ectypa]
MNVDLLYLPTTVSARDVTKELSKVLHSPEFHRIDNGRLFNFKVILNLNKKMGVRNDGTGMVLLPTKEIGNKFYSWAKATPIQIQGKKIRVGRRSDLLPGDAWALPRMPFIDPALDDEYEDKCQKLQGQIRVDAVQFGVLHYPSYPTSPNSRPALREYSIDWESECTAWLTFEYAYKAIYITLGDETKEYTCQSINISFSNINRLAVGYDGKPCASSDTFTDICFDTFTPPVFETFGFHRSSTGDEKRDRKRYKRRIGSLDPRHAFVTQYAHNLRLLLYPAPDIVEQFIVLCGIAGISPSHIVRFMPLSDWRMEVTRRSFFEQKKVWMLRKRIVEFNWTVAFQLELLLCNCLLHTEDLDNLIPLVKETCLRRPSRDDVFTGNLLRSYSEVLKNRSPRPYHTQSNRIIRRYPEFEDHFIRVEFRDENRLPYQWDQAVDRKPFLFERVGGFLKEGFELAGRKFEFLAYSNSALKEHSVWFINPFEYRHPSTKEVVWITADGIRDSIGDFKGEPIMTMPSKWAARLGQAFTSTNPSVTIQKDQWTVVDDLGLEPHLHTDGAGTISECRRGGPRLDDNPIRMRLRPSMRKFEDSRATEANIEIASYFNKPMPSYLNRQLVVNLEDKFVRREVFQELQDDAVANALTIDDSMQQFSDILEKHSLGNVYRSSYITRQISALGLDITTVGIDTPFLKDLRQVGKIHVLRDIKHRARILVSDSYQLIGVPDEGPAYEKVGYKNVFTLEKGNIYVQQVIAVKPPENMFCVFAHLRNVMVFPTVGDRSFPSVLGGGDLDGDTFIIIPNINLQPSRVDPPASYPPGKVYQAMHEDGTPRGVLSGRLLRIAGMVKVSSQQSSEGKFFRSFNSKALNFEQAVDYPKQGMRVELKRAPDRPKKPDCWKDPKERPAHATDSDIPSLSTDALYLKLRPSIEQHLCPYTPPDGTSHEIATLFHQYADKDFRSGSRGWHNDKARRDRIWRMGDQALQAVRDVQLGLLPYEGKEEIVTKEMSRAGLKHAWFLSVWRDSTVMGIWTQSKEEGFEENPSSRTYSP